MANRYVVHLLPPITLRPPRPSTAPLPPQSTEAAYVVVLALTDADLVAEVLADVMTTGAIDELLGTTAVLEGTEAEVEGVTTWLDEVVLG
jgi:hypothetical protein